MSRLRVLLTGASGFLGHYLSAELEGRAVETVCAGRRGAELELDLEDPGSIRRVLESVRPDRVLHAAAIASVGACATDPARADRVNHVASRVLAEASGGQVLLVSSDQVFDGADAPYRADDVARPATVYGTSKLAAERAVCAAGGSAARLPLLFGRSFDGRRGATDMIRSSLGPVRLFSNVFRTPLHAADAARGLVDCTLELERGAVVHVAGPERASRHELGVRFLRASGVSAELVAVETSDPQHPADLSLLSDVDCGRSLDEALAAS